MQERTYKHPCPSSSHIAREMLTYCHAPAQSCSRAIPCEDRALAIRGFPRPARAERDVKFFGRTDPSPTPPQGRRVDPLCPAGISPSMGRRAGAVLAVVTTPSHRGEGWGGVLGLGRGAARGRKTIPHKTSIRRHLPSLGYLRIVLMLSSKR